MSRTAESKKAGLKLRAQSKPGSLSFRLGRRKFKLPEGYEVRTLESTDYLFVHVLPGAELMKIDGNELRPVTSAEETKKAIASFKKKRKRSAAGGAGALDVPSDLKKALSNLPTGFKLAYGGDGTPRIVRSRRRRKA